MTGVAGSTTPPQSEVCAPRPSNASVAKPTHSVAGSNASFVTASPTHTPGARRTVLSAVEVRPVPHSVPGSTPTWPIESTTLVPALFVEHEGVVAVVPACAVRLVGLREDRRARRGLREHPRPTRGHRAREGDGEPWGHCAVEVHADRVAARGEVDAPAGRVVQLDRLVVRTALDDLADDEVGGLRCRGRGRRHEGRGGERSGDERGERRSGEAMGAWHVDSSCRIDHHGPPVGVSIGSRPSAAEGSSRDVHGTHRMCRMGLVRCSGEQRFLRDAALEPAREAREQGRELAALLVGETVQGRFDGLPARRGGAAHAARPSSVRRMRVRRASSGSASARRAPPPRPPGRAGSRAAGRRRSRRRVR